MKTIFTPLYSLKKPGHLSAFACGLVSLFLNANRVNADFTPNGTTHLNVYFNDGTGGAIAPTVSPYTPNILTTGSGNLVGTPLIGYSTSDWIQTGSPSPAPYPGSQSANWASSWSSSGVNAGVSYQQSAFWVGSNSASSSAVSPYGTSLSLNNPNNSTAELRLDWVTPYTYHGPPYAWTALGPVASGMQITDPNHNLEICTSVSGTSGSSTPIWPPPHSPANTTHTSDGTVTWTVFQTYAPGGITTTISGSVNQFSAIAGQESFALNGAPITTANTARMPLAGDFSSHPLSPTLAAFVDTSLSTYLCGFESPYSTAFYFTLGATVPSPQQMYDNDTLTVSGYLDVFVDPGSILVQIAPPVQLGITTYNNAPVVLFPTPATTNYVLQMSTNLTTGNWATVTNGIPITGIQITNAPSPAFFRLLFN